MNEQVAPLPSDVLGKGAVWRVGMLWERLANFLASPAELIGATEPNPLYRRLALGFVLGALLLPAFFAFAWADPIDGYRRYMLNAMPGPVATTMGSPSFAALLLSAFVALVVSINRAWSINEVDRELRVNRADPLPAAYQPVDLRLDGLFTAALLIPVVPLWLAAMNRASCQLPVGCLYAGASSYAAWATYAAHTWAQSVVPASLGWLGSDGIAIVNAKAAMLNVFVCYLVSGVFVFSAFELYRLSRVSAFAIDALERTFERAVAVGPRIIPQLERVFSLDGEGEHFSETFYKNAAMALGTIASARGLKLLRLLAVERRARVRNRAMQGIHDMCSQLDEQQRASVLEFLRERLNQEESVTVGKSLEKAIARYSPKPDLRDVLAA